MTSSKKAKKPSSSFKKAYGQDYTAGQGFTEEERDKNAQAAAGDNLGGRVVAATSGQKAVNMYKKLHGAQNSAAANQGAESSSGMVSQIEEMVPGMGESAVQTYETVNGATPQERGQVGGAGVVPAQAQAVPKANGPKYDQLSDREKKKRDYVDQRIAEERQKAMANKEAYDGEARRKVLEDNFDYYEANEDRRREIRDKKFNELKAEKEKNGERYNSSELMAEADEYATITLRKERDDYEEPEIKEEEVVKQDPNSIMARQEMLTKNLAWAGAALEAVGGIGERVNNGLDIMRGVLRTMLNPSPLGLNEAQTLLSTTAEAFNLANDVVGTLTKKGEEQIGKRVVEKMTKDMGEIIDKNFGGKDLSAMTPKELNIFTTELSQAWEPFMSRLELIGGDNPAGAAIARKLQSVFGQINTQAKDNKRDLAIKKKWLERRVRDLNNNVKAETFEATQKAKEYAKKYHKELTNPNNKAMFDPEMALAIELINKQVGRGDSNLPYELTHDANGNSIVDDDYYGVLLDQSLFLFNEGTGKFELHPRAAQIIAKRLSGMQDEINKMPLADRARYRNLEKKVYDLQVRSQQAMAQGKADAMAGILDLNSKSAIRRIIDLKRKNNKLYTVELAALGKLIGGYLPEPELDAIYRASGSDVVSFRKLEKQKTLTPDEEDMFTVSKNTQDMALWLKEMVKLRTALENARSKPGDADWIDPTTGTTKINPATGKNYKVAEVFPMDKIDSAVNQITHLMDTLATTIPIDPNQKDPSTGRVKRIKPEEVKIMDKRGNIVPMRDVLIKEFQIPFNVGVFKMPGGKYEDRIGMREIAAATREMGADLGKKMGLASNNVSNKIDQSVGLLDIGLENEGNKIVNAINNLGSVNSAGSPAPAGSQPPVQPGQKRSMPPWTSQYNGISGDVDTMWEAHYKGMTEPKDWPQDRYWDMAEEALALIENARGDVPGLRKIAQDAFRRGMFGDIQEINGTYVASKPKNVPHPKALMTVGADGKVYPAGSTEAYQYIDKDGNPQFLTAKGYQEILKGLYDMQTGMIAGRLDAKNNLDLSKDATNAAGGVKYMKALVKLFAPLL